MDRQSKVPDLRSEVDKELRAKFDELVRQDCDIAAKAGYNPYVFRQMVHDHGSVEACIRVIMTPDSRPPEGYVKLWELGLLHISAEARVLEWPWCQLFNDRTEVLRKAKGRLKKYERPDLASCRCLEQHAAGPSSGNSKLR